MSKEFNLEPGQYSFRHFRLGHVSLSVGERAVSLHGEREVGEGVTVQTLDLGAYGVTLQDALGALPRDIKTLLKNYGDERAAAKEGEVIYVHDIRSGLSLDQRRRMRNTGEVPAERRVLKSDAF